MNARPKNQDDDPRARMPNAQAARLPAVNNKIPATPVAAAMPPATSGISTRPSRLPVMRKVMAVARASGGATNTIPEMVSVAAMPSPMPIATDAAYMTGSEGTAMMANTAAPTHVLTSGSGTPPPPVM